MLKTVLIGHVDHGKSSLIGRLVRDCRATTSEGPLYREVDQLAEERAEQRTIDTIQVEIQLGSERHTLIDVPGHAEFIRNMVTGTAQAAQVILVVAADEGPSSLTRKHLAIAELMGVGDLLVVVNKMDLCAHSPERFSEVSQEIRALLGQYPDLKNAPIIGTSALEGKGIWPDRPCPNLPASTCLTDWLQKPRAISIAAQKDPAFFRTQAADHQPEGCWLMGRVLTGCLRPGQRVQGYPSGQSSLIQAITRYPKNLTKAEAGASVELLIEKDLAQDEFITAQGAPVSSNNLKGRIVWLTDKPLQNGSQLLLRTNLQQTAVTVHIPDQELGYTDMATAELVAETPIICAENSPLLRPFALEHNGRLVSGGVLV